MTDDPPPAPPVKIELDLTERQAALVELLRGRRTADQYLRGLIYADARRRAAGARHQYVSSGCAHGLHLQCQRMCSSCSQRCLCACHRR